MLIFYLSLLADESDKLNFEKLYRKYGDIVLRYAMSRLRNQHNAEDAAHDTWIWVAEHFERFHTLDEISIRNYIMKIVANRCNDVFRKQKRDAALFEDIENEMTLNESVYTDDVLVSFCEREDCQSIVASIKRLDARYRDVLNLYYLNESSSKEIAQILQLKDSTVRQRLARGRRMLITLLAEKGLHDES